MKKNLCFAFIVVFLLFLRNAYSANLSGELILYDPSGFPILPAGFVPVTGVVDIDNNILIIDDFQFFSTNTVTNILEILPPGSYTRIHNGITLNATIDPGNIGAYMIIEWNFIEIPLIMGWTVTSNNTIYTPVDVDGDGVPGMRILNGPFTGLSAVYDFTSEPPGPGVKLTLSVDGGTIQECSANGGSEVTINAIPQLFGGASLDSITWTVDGNDTGSGLIITEFLSLGQHTVEAIATTTTGETGTASTIITVRDTTRPDLHISFINNQGQEVDLAGPGPVEINMSATDICDANPVISNGTATPTAGIVNGDVLHINSSKGNLKLPTTSLRVDATATDSSGNNSSSSAILTLE